MILASRNAKNIETTPPGSGKVWEILREFEFCKQRLLVGTLSWSCGRGWEVLSWRWLGCRVPGADNKIERLYSQNLSKSIKNSQISHVHHLYHQSSSRHPEISPWQALGIAYAAACCECACATPPITPAPKLVDPTGGCPPFILTISIIDARRLLCKSNKNFQ